MKEKRKGWASVILIAGYLGLFVTTLYVPESLFKVTFFFFWLCIGFIALGMTQEDVK